MERAHRRSPLLGHPHKGRRLESRLGTLDKSSRRARRVDVVLAHLRETAAYVRAPHLLGGRAAHVRRLRATVHEPLDLAQHPQARDAPCRRARHRSQLVRVLLGVVEHAVLHGSRACEKARLDAARVERVEEDGRRCVRRHQPPPLRLVCVMLRPCKAVEAVRETAHDAREGLAQHGDEGGDVDAVVRGRARVPRQRGVSPGEAWRHVTSRAHGPVKATPRAAHVAVIVPMVVQIIGEPARASDEACRGQQHGETGRGARRGEGEAQRGSEANRPCMQARCR